jgi:hypothetical protein
MLDVNFFDDLRIGLATAEDIRQSADAIIAAAQLAAR